MSDWKDLWEERGRCYPYKDATKIDGFNHAAGKLNREQVDFLVDKIKSILNLTRNDLLLEAGCGAGMLLGPLSAHVHKVIGVDYAAAMVKRCRELFPNQEVLVAEVQNLPFSENTFDKIVCFSVFQYFPDLKYAKRALSEFIRVCKPGGGIFIGDVPDEETKQESLRYRKKISQQPEWRSSITADLRHLYYIKKFFRDFLNLKGIECEITQQDIPGYGNSPYRFNVVFRNTK